MDMGLESDLGIDSIMRVEILSAIKDEAPFNREQITRYLEKHGIQTRPIFAGNIIRQPAYRNVEYKTVGDLHNSDKILRDSFFVGVYPGLNEDDMRFIGSTLRDIDYGRSRISRK